MTRRTGRYSNIGRNVVSMVQFDMLGWPMDITTPIGLTEDYVSPELSAFVGTLTTTYSALTWEASDPPLPRRPIQPHPLRGIVLDNSRGPDPDGGSLFRLHFLCTGGRTELSISVLLVGSELPHFLLTCATNADVIAFHRPRSAATHALTMRAGTRSASLRPFRLSLNSERTIQTSTLRTTSTHACPSRGATSL